MLIFAEWNLPQRFFRARPAKIAGSETWGRGLGHMPQKSIKSLRDSSLYMYSGAPIFFLRNFLRNFLRHFFGKIASRATKMLERAFISQGKRTFRKEWIFAAAVFQSSSREKSEEQKLGSAFCRKGFFPNQTLRVLALTMVNGQVKFFGVFLRIPFGKNTFCDLHFFSSKNPDSFFRKKVASRATKMLERALISQGKVKSALVARETCLRKFRENTVAPYATLAPLRRIALLD